MITLGLYLKKRVMSTTLSQANRVLLHNLSWQQFENLLLDLGDSRAARVAYEDGTLEIMTPLPEHEFYNEAISILIEDIAETLEIDYECLGSSTWKREKYLAGVEPDNCFYFQNEALIRGQLDQRSSAGSRIQFGSTDDFDLDHDPPPDLALEIDLTSKSLNRFSIYARLGVPEIWCYDSGALSLYQLQGETYQEVETSAIFPTLPIKEIPELIERYRGEGRRSLRRAIRQWAIAHQSF